MFQILKLLTKRIFYILPRSESQFFGAFGLGFSDGAFLGMQGLATKYDVDVGSR